MEIALSLRTLPERYLGVPQRSPAEPAESTLVQSTDMPSQWASLSPAIYGTDHFYLKMLPDSPKTQKRESGLPAPSKSFEPFAVMKNERRFLHRYERRPARWPPGPACCTQTPRSRQNWESPRGASASATPSAQNAPSQPSPLHLAAAPRAAQQNPLGGPLQDTFLSSPLQRC